MTGTEFLTAVERAAAVDASDGWLLADRLSAPRSSSHPGALAWSGRLGGIQEPGTVTGTWAAVAGAAEAEWLLLTAAPPGAPGEPRVVLVPAGDAEIGPPRPAGGLGRADLRDVTVRGATVPPDRVLDAFAAHDPVPGATGLPAATATLVSRAAVALGVAGAAAGDFLAGVRHRSRPGAVVRSGEHSAAQRDVLRAMTAVRAARELLHAEVRATPSAPDLADRARLGAAALHAQSVAQELVGLVFTRSGGSALYVGHPLQQRWCDSEEIACHGFGEDVQRAVAAAMFGMYAAAHLC